VRSEPNRWCTVQALGGECVDLNRIYERVVVGDAPGVKEVVEQAVAEGVPPLKIIFH